MNCREIQEIVITDYIDGQLDQKRKCFIEEHLAQCHHCKEFFILTQESSVKPFISAERQKPPEIIWENIREVLGAQQEEKINRDVSLFSLVNFLNKIGRRPYLFALQPVRSWSFTLTSMVTLIFMIGILPQLMMTNPTVKMDQQGQIEYLSYLTDGGGVLPASNSTDLGTPIEKYFL